MWLVLGTLSRITRLELGNLLQSGLLSLVKVEASYRAKQANCQLGVYNVARRQGDEPVLQPPLQAIAIEQYQGIPGAEVVFPKTGLCQL